MSAEDHHIRGDSFLWEGEETKLSEDEARLRVRMLGPHPSPEFVDQVLAYYYAMPISILEAHARACREEAVEEDSLAY